MKNPSSKFPAFQLNCLFLFFPNFTSPKCFTFWGGGRGQTSFHEGAGSEMADFPASDLSLTSFPLAKHPLFSEIFLLSQFLGFPFHFQHGDLRRVIEGTRIGDGCCGAGLGVPGEILRDRDQFRDF